MKRKLLIVDDERSILRILKRVFNNLEYDVKYSVSGEKALEELETFTPDLVLLDLMMPGTDGLQVTEKMNENPKFINTRIVIVTADTSSETVDKCYKQGVTDFVRKPFLETELKQKVDTLLDLQSTKSINKLNLCMLRSLRNMIAGPIGNIRGFTSLIKENFNKENTSTSFTNYGLSNIDKFSKQVTSVVDSLLLYNSVESNTFKFDIKVYQQEDLLKILSTDQVVTKISVPPNIYMFDKNLLIFIVGSLYRWIGSKLVSVDVVGGDTRFDITLNTSGMGDTKKIFNLYEERPIFSGDLDVVFDVAVAKRCVEAHNGSLVTNGSVFSIIISI